MRKHRLSDHEIFEIGIKYGRGHSYARLAKKYDIPEKRVASIISALRKNKAQLPRYRAKKNGSIYKSVALRLNRHFAKKKRDRAKKQHARHSKPLEIKAA